MRYIKLAGGTFFACIGVVLSLGVAIEARNAWFDCHVHSTLVPVDLLREICSSESSQAIITGIAAGGLFLAAFICIAFRRRHWLFGRSRQIPVPEAPRSMG